MKIAVDAMGGDHAPRAIVQGAVDAALAGEGRYEVLLVGNRTEIEHELDRIGFSNSVPVSIAEASEVIEMHESPTTALKRKPDSSISVATQLHKLGEVSAVVSAGNTGAVMASTLLGLGRIKGVKRPAIGSVFPTQTGFCLIIDVGANVDCKPEHLLQFGVMGSIHVSHVFGRRVPAVGLLNIGEESSKGSEAVLAAYQLLSEHPHINFAGNIEGRDILRGVADVVVCDGFVGNVVLKLAESVVGALSTSLKGAIGKNLVFNLGAFLMRESFRILKRQFDYEEYGGAPLLGIDGTCIISHGGSTPKAIRNAVLEAEKMITENVNAHIREELESRASNQDGA